jgi:hypothetical protein
MSRKNTLPFAGRFCFSWHPAPAGSSDAASVGWFASLRISGSHLALVRSCSGRRQATRWQLGQPWFYLRLAPERGTMALLGCAREHTVAHETDPPIPPRILTLEPVRAALHLRTSGLRLPDLVVVRAYAACKFRCSASNVSPFFHRIRAIAAILRASVSRAMAGNMPWATRIS